MPAHHHNGTLNLTHSKYYYQSPASLPFKPLMYWNVITSTDIIPVITYGYKNEQIAERTIKKYYNETCKLVYVETEEEHKEYVYRAIKQVFGNY